MKAHVTRRVPKPELDFAKLEKGTVIDQETIESIYNVRREDDPDGFRLAQVKLVDAIERHRGELYPRTERRTVRIMDDREAEAYNAVRHKAHVDGLRRDATRRERIDRGEFSDAERRAAEHRDRSYSMIALAAQRELIKAERRARLLGAGEQEDS